MSDAKPSPLPWRCERDDFSGWIEDAGGDAVVRAGGVAAADARFIVRACNAHEELLAALRKCDDAFVSWQLGQIPGRPEDIQALISDARAAIAKAEGRS